MRTRVHATSLYLDWMLSLYASTYGIDSNETKANGDRRRQEYLSSATMQLTIHGW